MTFEEALEPHVHEDPTWHVVLGHKGQTTQWVLVAPTAKAALAAALERWVAAQPERKRRKGTLPQLLNAAVFGPAALAWTSEAP